MTKPSTVLVLGGAGFVGRHAVSALLEIGAIVVIGSRNPDSIQDHWEGRAAACQRRQCRMESLTMDRHWDAHLSGVDVVLNCVGILRQRGRETYDRVHNLAPTALAISCARSGVRLVHVSALGLFPQARSRFITSKIAGENGIRKTAADWAIVRPSLLDGDGGFGASWLRAVSRLPAYFALAGASGKIAALDVRDLGEALARLCENDFMASDEPDSRTFEFGGQREFRFTEYIETLRQTYTTKPAVCIPVPNLLARAVAHFFDLIHFTPFSFGHWELLQRDNSPDKNRLAEVLGRPPRAVASGHSEGLAKEI